MNICKVSKFKLMFTQNRRDNKLISQSCYWDCFYDLDVLEKVVICGRLTKSYKNSTKNKSNFKIKNTNSYPLNSQKQLKMSSVFVGF